MTSIHKRIKARRLALGLTQEDLASRLNVTYQTVQQWETDPDPDDPKVLSTAPRRTRLLAVADALQTTPGWLLYGFDNAPKMTSEEEAQIILFYRGMSPELRKLFQQQGHTYFSLSNPKEPPKPPDKED